MHTGCDPELWWCNGSAVSDARRCVRSSTLSPAPKPERLARQLPELVCMAQDRPPCTGAGLTSYGSQICMTNALRFARAAPALAMSYVSVIITLIYGYFIFNEVPPAPAVPGLQLPAQFGLQPRACHCQWALLVAAGA